jgi:probable DNA metabolism protein
VDREIHRLMGLLRFNPRPDGIWLACCAPDHYILPVFGEHYCARFGEAPWAIIDEKRNLALVRLKGKEPCFGSLVSFSFLTEQSAPEDDWEELWRSYHQSISIENRRNPLLQMQLMPRRYWKYLPELKKSTTSP